MLNKISIDLFVKKTYKDDLYINNNGNLLKDILSENKHKKSLSLKIERKKNLKTLFEEITNDKTKSTKSESFEKDSIDDTEHSSKSQNNTDDLKRPVKRALSLSCNNLIKIEPIDSSIEEPKRNISDDESEKMNRELNKPDKKYLEKLKKDNIDFSNNMKNIFNNIGNITRYKSDKSIEENKEESEFLLKCYIKSENIRKVYYSKLLLNRVWIPLNDSQRHNNLIIFDWDDTLFCTSYLENKYNISVNENIKINENEKLNLLKLEEKVFKILHLAINSGDTYIVTNSSEGWVNYVTNIFYPLVYKFLINSNKIKIISARKLYENEYPNNQSFWKLATFINISKLYNKNVLTNIMCFGDSNLEIEAINRISPLFKESYIKAIMFMQNPNILQLNKQLKLCLNEFTKIHSLVKNISIKVIKKD
jgi:hypothetical protein